jgi:hypothetical protein
MAMTDKYSLAKLLTLNRTLRVALDNPTVKIHLPGIVYDYNQHILGWTFDTSEKHYACTPSTFIKTLWSVMPLLFFQ